MSDKTVDQYLGDLASKRASEVATLTFPSSRLIEEIMRDTLAQDVNAEGVVVAHGIMAGYAFDPVKLEAHRDEVKAMIALLPDEFLVEGGGGWSFLNLCTAKDGTLWTGLHQKCDELVVLAIALKIGKYMLPRSMWASFPGGVPYVQFTLKDGEELTPDA